MGSVEDFIAKVPKAELHLHIEGSLEPELMWQLAQRNNITLKFDSVEAIRAAYEFSDLQSFLDIYYEGAGVLLQEQDFYDLMWAYLERCKEDTITHTEIFFDPQTHTDRGISMDTVVSGLTRALKDGESKLGITWRLIPNFLRHLSEEAAMKTFEELLPHREVITGFGLDSSEVGHPPTKFQNVFRRVREEGFRVVAHAGEEGPPQYIYEALDILKVARVDHGVRCLEDKELVERLKKEQVPLTVCPLSNIKLRVFDQMKDHNLKELMAAGLVVTVNSDDPAYFGGYLNTNFIACYNALNLSRDEVAQLAKASFSASFLPKDQVERHHQAIDALL